jgi:hypothetical protein
LEQLIQIKPSTKRAKDRAGYSTLFRYFKRHQGFIFLRFLVFYEERRHHIHPILNCGDLNLSKVTRKTDKIITFFEMGFVAANVRITNKANKIMTGDDK